MNTKTTLSDLSIQRLNACHPDLQKVILEVAKTYPLKVIQGFRGEADQNKAFESGHSNEKWPNSKHNKVPALAVDIAPSPYDPNDRVRIAYLAGMVMKTASSLNIRLRWGGDWNQNFDLSDEKLSDMYHFELLGG